VTGVLLLIAYPTKAMTNPVFYFKLLYITIAVITMRKMNILFDDASLSDTALIAKGKSLAVMSLTFWIAAVSAGRLLSETYRFLNYHQYLIKTGLS
jgi:hypothetical protein